MCPRERETEDREGKRVACFYTHKKKSFGEMSAYNLVRGNKEKERVKEETRTRSEKDNNNLRRHRTQKRILE